jgi:hypothetical protein
MLGHGLHLFLISLDFGFFGLYTAIAMKKTDTITVIGFNGETAEVSRLVVEAWLNANKKLDKAKHGFWRTSCAKKQLDRAAGFRVFTVLIPD